MNLNTNEDTSSSDDSDEEDEAREAREEGSKRVSLYDCDVEATL